MGSNYFGDGNSSHERGFSSSASSSSRKGKKNGSDKPKQPQRGLGVAQLEKIRLHTESGRNYPPPVHNPYAQGFSQQEEMRLRSSYASSPSHPPYAFPGAHGVWMGFQDLDRANIRYGESQQGNVARWPPGNAGVERLYSMQPSMTTRSFLDPNVEGPYDMNDKKDGRDDPFAYNDQNSESSGCQDIDLELRL
ncbi:protein SPEAR3-like isoform X1 [Primulina eburnea]|uniref:protein SPEAR3-like isoform X1 n=1 Tax=Primulina eburnea TaxID=1245227 RepID=UPI003C6BFCFE